MPTAPVTPPEAPVKPPVKLPSFLVDIIVKYATDAAPTIGTAAAKSLSSLLKKAGQEELSPIEAAHVQGVVVMAVVRLAGVLK